MSRGYKNCPSCKKEVLAVSKNCKCGYVFTNGKKNIAKPIVGKKTCPKCKNIVGNRTLECSCGFSFSTYLKHKKRKKSYRDILRYILKRMQQKNYRGHKVEHHRVTTNSRKIKEIIEWIYAHEYSHGPLELDSDIYLSMITKINGTLGYGTKYSFRKNILTDMNRMGYIDRLDENKKISNGGIGKRIRYKYISVTKRGRRLARIDPNNIIEREKAHYNATIKLLGKDYINFVLNIMEETDYLSVKEYMYFICNATDFEKVIENIKKYRTLSKLEQNMIDKKVENEAEKVSKKAKNRTEKRYINGWKNETCQICKNLNNINGIHFTNEQLVK